MAALDDANAGGVEETPDPSVTQIGSGGIAAGDGSESGDGGVNSGEGEGGGFAGEARGDAGEGGGEARGEAAEGGGDGGEDDGEDSNDSGEGSGNRGNSPTPPPLTDAWQVTVEVPKQSRGRVRQRPTVKRPVRVETESDSEGTRKRKAHAGSESGSGRKAPRTESAHAGSAGKAPRAGAGTSKGRQEVIDCDSEDDGEEKSGSRHMPVSVSEIYNTWNGPLLHSARRRFQTLIMARDGYPLRKDAKHKDMNFKLVLKAAQAVMADKDYRAFSGAMERAYKETTDKK